MSIKKITSVLIFLFAIFLLMSAIVITREISASTGKGLMLANESGIASFREIVTNEEYFKSNVTAYSIEEKAIATDGQTARVNAIFTDQKYCNAMQMKLLAGTWFNVSDLDRENNSIVIGSDLSTQIFFSTDVIGKEIVLDGRIYWICGVYESDDSIIGRLSSNSRHTIYLPYTATNQNVQYLFLGSEADIINTEEVKYFFSDKLNINVAAAQASNTSEKTALLRALPCVFIKTLIAFSLLFLILFLSKLLANVFYREVKGSIRLYLIISLSLLLFAGCIYLLCTLPRIPDSYLPSENIFDVGHYFNLFIERVQAANDNTFNAMDKKLLIAFIVVTSEYVIVTSICAALMVLNLPKLGRRIGEGLLTK